MEATGVLVDRVLLGEMSRGFNKELTALELDIYRAGGGEFNINSTPQLRTVLFERLKLPVQKRTKTGASTDVEVLEQLATLGHEVPRLLIEYRELTKLKSTYIDALPGYIRADGRVHTSFNQTGAATGRLSSSDPNLQNIPVRTPRPSTSRRSTVKARWPCHANWASRSKRRRRSSSTTSSASAACVSGSTRPSMRHARRGSWRRCSGGAATSPSCEIETSASAPLVSVPRPTRRCRVLRPTS